ncbi:major facilitator superfamily domain-containing protein 4A-like isoform X2 [Ptychodera flava]|uniref:major facilitator superfamily domain-containing protein 4A-like isoform X2 n=1 Tax=Ptychodera flava TaxID=63121 RepID=UPI00396A24B0
MYARIVLVVFSAGHLVGTIAGGFWFDHFDSHLLLALAMLGLAVVGAFIPWCPMWGILILNFVLLGCMTGCFETGPKETTSRLKSSALFQIDEMQREPNASNHTYQFVPKEEIHVTSQEHDKLSDDEKIVEVSVPTDETVAKSNDDGIARRRFKTLLVGMSFLGLGMTAAIPGPTLLDLQFQVQSTFEQIALVLSIGNIGYFFGSIAGGFLFDRFDNNLLLALTIVGLAVLGALVPWCPVFGVLILNCVFWGCTRGCLDIGGNVYCVNLWGKESGPYMQAIHFSFAVGAAIAPLIAGPFLMPQVEEYVISSALNETSTMLPTRLPTGFVSAFLSGDAHTASPQDYNSTLLNEIVIDETNGSLFPADVGDLSGAAPSLKTWIPYTIMSLFNLLMSLPFFCLFVTESRQVCIPQKEPRNIKKQQDSAGAEKKDRVLLLCF